MRKAWPRTAAIVVNYNTATLTARSVQSLRSQSVPVHLVVVENGSTPTERRLLRELVGNVDLIESDRNLGFAGACNLAIKRVLASTEFDAVLLFNSDARAASGLVAALLSRLDPTSRTEMVGAAMERDTATGEIDSMGIAYFASCLASNRTSSDEVLFGPTGGCALYSRRLLEDVTASHGYVFDPRFFCYAEDTDLAARALLLGYRPAICDGRLAWHVGQASSGGGFSSFVLYHGIRNSVWAMIKNLPWSIILPRLHQIAVMHAGIIVRHIARGEAGTVFRLYLDAIRGLPSIFADRRRIQASRRITPRHMAQFFTPHFYQSGSIRDAVRELFRFRDRRG